MSTVQPAIPADIALASPPSDVGGDAQRAPRTHSVEQWLIEHGDTLWRFALARTGSREVAEDIVQDTLLAAIKSAESFTGSSRVSTWLLGIASHKVADHFRRLRRDRIAKGLPTDAPAATDVHAALFTPEGRWKVVPRVWTRRENQPIADTELDALKSCIEKLPPAQRETIWLRDVLEVPPDAACQQLHLSRSNFWTRLHRARTALRWCIEHALQDDNAPASASMSKGGRP
jgi:RNA polymerase sigma-70 factor (ECF subfamily)